MIVHVFYEMKAILNDVPSNAYRHEANSVIQQFELENANGNTIIEKMTQGLQELQPLKSNISVEDCDYTTLNKWLIQLRLASGDLTYNPS